MNTFFFSPSPRAITHTTNHRWTPRKHNGESPSKMTKMTKKKPKFILGAKQPDLALDSQKQLLYYPSTKNITCQKQQTWPDNAFQR